MPRKRGGAGRTKDAGVAGAVLWVARVWQEDVSVVRSARGGSPERPKEPVAASCSFGNGAGKEPVAASCSFGGNGKGREGPERRSTERKRKETKGKRRKRKEKSGKERKGTETK